MASTYKIVSHWDGQMSSLDGEEYDTFDGALADCRRVGPDGLVAESVDHNERAWLVYADEESAEADVGGCANNAIARIETVSAESEVDDDCVERTYQIQERITGKTTWTSEPSGERYQDQASAERDVARLESTNDDGEAVEYRVVEVDQP